MEIQVRKDDIYMSITTEHNGVVLGDSNSILIKANYEEDTVHPIDFTVNLPINVIDKQMINSVVSVPVLSEKKINLYQSFHYLLHNKY